jgi:hypothetical protein
VPSNPSSEDSAFVRKYQAGSPMQSFNPFPIPDNSADFNYLAVDATVGTNNPVLGAPAPHNLRSPTNHSNFLQSTLADPNQPDTAPPNRVISGNTVTFSYKVTNCSNALPDPQLCPQANNFDLPPANVERLQFRLTDLATRNNSNQANFAATSSPSLTLEFPFEDPPGGGLNSILVADDVTPSTPIAPGDSVTVNFTFNILQRGQYHFGFNAEDDLEPVKGGGPVPTPTPTPTSPTSPGEQQQQSQSTGQASGSIPTTGGGSGGGGAGQAPGAGGAVTTPTKKATKKKAKKVCKTVRRGKKRVRVCTSATKKKSTKKHARKSRTRH